MYSKRALKSGGFESRNCVNSMPALMHFSTFPARKCVRNVTGTVIYYHSSKAYSTRIQQSHTLHYMVHTSNMLAQTSPLNNANTTYCFFVYHPSNLAHDQSDWPFVFTFKQTLAPPSTCKQTYTHSVYKQAKTGGPFFFLAFEGLLQPACGCYCAQ